MSCARPRCPRQAQPYRSSSFHYRPCCQSSSFSKQYGVQRNRGQLTFGYGIQRLAINPVMGRPVLLTLTLTFGLNLLLDNTMLSFFRADYRKIILDAPLGVLTLGPATVPIDRLAATACGLLLVSLLWILL